jgi:hypothetical protein
VGKRSPAVFLPAVQRFAVPIKVPATAGDFIMRIAPWRSVAWAVLASGIIVGPLGAAPTTKSTGHVSKTTTAASTGSSATGTAGTTQTNHKAHLETAISLLHDAHRLVAGAHFAYDGHRAKALKEIDRAVRELAPPKPPTTNTQTTTHHTTTHVTTMGQRPPAPQPTQAEADTKLREAIVLLNRAHGRITENPQAAEDVGAAITELKAALQHP